MGGGIDRTHRRIQALYATGPLGALGDAELLGRFAAGEGLDREDAFAALVRRHGPMVLSTCRRMLRGDRDGAEDAFQAVFLVLARKAGSLRRPDDLRPWLYGVAVKAGKEARRRAGRIHAREGGAIIDAPAPRADADLFDLRAAIDEELERLPGRYRDPILLCELEGASRRDAAERLGLAEGTLSSRLARGRSLLRDRLTRRGLAVGTFGAALAPTARAAGLDALADASVRLVLASPSLHGTPGTASAAVAIAEGVLAMLTAAKFKALTTAATAALGLLVVTAGFAWGLSGPAPEPAPAVALGEPAPTPGSSRVRGVVVDEEGRPIAGAKVFLNAYTSAESHATTGADGSYEMDPKQPWIDDRSILARTADGLRLGNFKYPVDLVPGEAAKPARIVVRPGREVVARVADAAGMPIVGAAVEVLGNHNVVAHASTGPDGLARLTVPADESVKWVVARKAATGFDYAEFGEQDAHGTIVAGVSPDALPSPVGLTLANPRAVRIKAVDTDGRPVAGVLFYSARIVKQSTARSRGVGGWSRLFDETTDADGVATFDWLPDAPGWTFMPSTQGRYIDPQTHVEPGHADPVVVELKPSVVIRGRVVQADGAPAADVRVRAFGQGKGYEGDAAHTRTGRDGSYALHVPPNMAYVVWTDVDGWDAPPRPGLIAKAGQDLDGVDLQLKHGTVLRGTLTIGPDANPAAADWLQITQSFGDVPAGALGEGETAGRHLHRYINAVTDARGRFAVHLAPGTYSVRGPADAEGRTVVVAGEPELRMDLSMPRPRTGRFAGLVVDADGKPVAGAVVEFGEYLPSKIAQADADGRFAFDRRLDRMILRASSPDGNLAGMAEFGPDDAEGVVAARPTATATGLLLDEEGEPLRRQKLDWGRRFPDDGSGFMHVFGPEVVTDDEGRFTLPSLVVGETYRVGVKRGNVYPSAGFIQPSRPGPIDVGPLRIGSGDGGGDALFRDGAPDVGAASPAFEATTLGGKPLALGDFAGKYVLLNLWATWSVPSIREMSHIQAVYDEFGKDGRLAIVSLSLDETIDAPRKFQENRKLPWTVGWAGGGIEGGPAAAYGVRAIPALFLIGPDGKIIDRGMRGEMTRDVVRATAKPR